MDPQHTLVRKHTLVRIYLFVCQRYCRRLRAVSQRQSNNSRPDFTDEEVLTIYLFGIIKKRKTIREIYDYIADHFSAWFPELPSYKSYNRRLNRLSAVFAPLVQEALAKVSDEETRKEAVRIADSVPIMMAKEKRSSQASVASEFADKGYCSSKGVFFYGVKLHVVGEQVACGRRAQARQDAGRGMCRADAWQRKRPHGSAPRSAYPQRRAALRR